MRYLSTGVCGGCPVLLPTAELSAAPGCL